MNGIFQTQQILQRGYALCCVAVMFSAFAVSAAAQSSALPYQQPSRHALQSKDYGWDIDKDGELMFIMQLSPTEISQMSQYSVEDYADMPIELVGRVKRISVRIGTNELPRNPPLEKIATMPILGTADGIARALGQGRMKELDSSRVVNVQDPGRPSLPPPGMGQNLVDQASRTAQGASSADSSRFLQGAGGQATSLPIPSTSANPSTSVNPNNPSSSKFSDTALPPMTAGGGSSQSGGVADWRSTMGQASQQRTDAGQGLVGANPKTNLPRSGGLPSYESVPQDYTGGGGSSLTDLQGPAPNFGSSPTYTDNNRNLGQRMAGQSVALGNAQRRDIAGRTQVPGSQSGFSNGRESYGAESYGAEGYGRGAYARDEYGAPRGVAKDRYEFADRGYPDGGYGRRATTRSDRLARDFYDDPRYDGRDRNLDRQQEDAGLSGRLANTLFDRIDELEESLRKAKEAPALPATSAPQARLASSTKPAENTGNEGAENSPSNAASATKTTGNTSEKNGPSTMAKTGSALVQMFFLVSLVANCYLVYLIRKLLTRYRSLLSTVRSHAV